METIWVVIALIVWIPIIIVLMVILIGHLTKPGYSEEEMQKRIKEKIGIDSFYSRDQYYWDEYSKYSRNSKNRWDYNDSLSKGSFNCGPWILAIVIGIFFILALSY